jgi:outer membrane lipoprotein SlyB
MNPKRLKRLWCTICNRMVEVVVEEGASALIAPLLGGAVGHAIGRAKGGWTRALVGTAVGVVAGLAARAAIPEAQRIVCRGCGSHIG